MEWITVQEASSIVGCSTAKIKRNIAAHGRSPGSNERSKNGPVIQCKKDKNRWILEKSSLLEFFGTGSTVQAEIVQMDHDPVLSDKQAFIDRLMSENETLREQLKTKDIQISSLLSIIDKTHQPKQIDHQTGQKLGVFSKFWVKFGL